MLSRLVWLLSALIFFGGCGLGDKPPEKKVPQVGNKSRECFPDMRVYVRDYISQKLNTEEIGRAWDCTDRALNLFLTFVNGKRTDQFTASELKDFVESYIVPKQPMSKEFFLSLLRFKQAVVGGEENVLTKAEVAKGQKLFKLIKKHLIALYPYADLLFLRKSVVYPKPKGDDPKRLQKFEVVLGQAFLDLGQFLSESRRSYAFKDFESLYRHTSSYLGLQFSQKIFEPSSFVEVLRQTKIFLVSGADDRVSPEEWEKGLFRLAQVYGVFLNFYYREYFGESIFKDPGLTNLERLANLVFDFLRDSVDRHGGLLPTQRLLLLSRAFESADVLPEKISVRVIEDVWSVALRLLSTPMFRESSQDQGTLGLTRHHIAYAESEFYLWYQIQKLILSGTNSGAQTAKIAHQGSAFLTSPSSSTSPVSPLFGPLKLDRSPESEMLALQRIKPLFLPKQDLVLLLPEPRASLNPNFNNSTWINTIRAGVRLVNRGYSRQVERAIDAAAIEEDEVQEFYSQVRSVGIALGIMDPRSRLAGVRTFKEANLFTSNSNGNNFMEIEEAVEIVSILISSGNISRSMFKSLEPTCATKEKDAILGFSLLLNSCAQKEIKRQFSYFFPNLPEMGKYVEGMSDAEWDGFYYSLRSIGVPSVPDSDKVEVIVLDILATVLHYCESVFARFDQNADGLLGSTELWKAYSVFDSLLGIMIHSQLGDWLNDWSMTRLKKALFAYLLLYGDTPQSTSDKWTFFTFVATGVPEQLEINRAQLAKTFSRVVHYLQTTRQEIKEH